MDVVARILTVVGLGAFELWAAIPAGFALGLHPIVTASSATAGAALAVLGVLALGEGARAWLARRRSPGDSSSRSVREIWMRYGVVGLGFAAPLLVGAPLGTVLGLVLGAPRRHLFTWMMVGVVGWSAIVTLALLLGLVGLDSLS